MRPRLLPPFAARALSPLPRHYCQSGSDLLCLPRRSICAGGSFIPFTPFSGDDIWRWEVGAAFERLIFQPEPSHLEASETDGKAQRPTERERRSQDVEIELATAFFDLFSRSASWDLCAFDDGQMR